MTFGNLLRMTLFGASHAPSLGVCLEGVPAGLPLSEADFMDDIDRRRAGAEGTTPRRERDVPHLESGVTGGSTDGGPLRIEFLNENVRSSDYDRFARQPRPSHADFTARARYGCGVDLRGGGIFSGRMTLPLVAAGVVAKRILPSARYATAIVEVGGETNPARFGEVVSAARADGDSVGGIIECRVSGIPAGLGEPFFDSVESVVSHLLFSIPAVKGVEFGSGFAGVRLRGSQRNDRIADADGHTFTNNDGGIAGGITNGNDLAVRVAVKPTPSISLPQQTYDFERGCVAPLRITGRHDACIALRAGVVVEAMVAFALADLSLRGGRP